MPAPKCELIKLPWELIGMIIQELSMLDLIRLITVCGSHPVFVERLYELERKDAVRQDFHVPKDATEKHRKLWAFRNWEPLEIDQKLPALYWAIQNDVPSVVRVATREYLKDQDASFELLTGGYREKRRIYHLMSRPADLTDLNNWQDTLPYTSTCQVYDELHDLVASPSPLQLAVATGNLDIVRDITELYLKARTTNLELLSLGSEVRYNSLATVQLDPLGIAAHLGYHKISAFLLEKGVYGNENHDGPISTQIFPILFARKQVDPELMKSRAKILQQLIDSGLVKPKDPVFHSAEDPLMLDSLKITPLQQAVLDITHTELAKVLIRAGAPWAPWTETQAMPFQQGTKTRSLLPCCQTVVEADSPTHLSMSPLEIVLSHRKDDQLLENQWELFVTMMEEGGNESPCSGNCPSTTRLRFRWTLELVKNGMFYGKAPASLARQGMVKKMMNYLRCKGKLDGLDGDMEC
ncbi:hypothetical protein QBC41DRAFT_307939 [Cercophora samala]|uniref:Uncharacterized protein n=1 Tax=Cercophora samala TaxID=330535 RepID=A0AA40D410_9PEZI|nr:hypothetical protein QBC41DRAFT_307939 [Cercophora samala]